ncbi:protein CUP-SHAPED COTYLEDON 1-like [Panicum miliaceum]|uniref:Protein CUP-SHAPED COTYLEDON 1-like n=1 Tax=Panicum miliaceum TaxID=4540 RepID=A0A3L6QVK7_PANMI|nr:protein CUP-SHAPED COTYLEDON 1-like [Panicum miliaceum]
MDPAIPYYSTACASSISVPPVMPPMASMGSAGLHMNGAMFGNPMANASSMSFFHQMGMEAEGTSSFIATPEIRPS